MHIEYGESPKLRNKIHILPSMRCLKFEEVNAIMQNGNLNAEDSSNKGTMP